MKKLMIPALLSCCVFVTGCATTGSTGGMFGQGAKPQETTEQTNERKQNNQRAARSGFLQGCVGGGVGGLLSGGLKNAIRGCIAGGLVVGSTSWIAENNRQLDAARSLASEVKAAGGQATVAEKTVEVKNEQGQTQSVQTLDRLTIQFPPAALAAKNDMAKNLIKKATAMAASSKVPVEILAYGKTMEESQWIAMQVGEHILTLPKTEGGGVTVRNVVGTPARLELSPVPQL